MDNLYLVHSAKGTEWKNHKYIKKSDGKYYYQENSDKEKSDIQVESMNLEGNKDLVQAQVDIMNLKDNIEYLEREKRRLQISKRRGDKGEPLPLPSRENSFDNKVEQIDRELEDAKLKLEEANNKYESMSNLQHSDELYHHGILGQRKGIRNGPPYPLDYSKLNVREKKLINQRIDEMEDKGYSVRKIARKTHLTKEAVEGRMNRRKIQTAKTESERLKKETEEKKSQIINTGNVNEAMKYKDSFTNEELNAVINRYDLNQKLNDRMISSKPVEKSTFDKIISVTEKYSTIVEKGSRAYDETAKVLNAFTGAGLPIINGNNKNKNNNNKNKNNNQNSYNDEINKQKAKQAKIQTKVDKENLKTLKNKHKNQSYEIVPANNQKNNNKKGNKK